MAEYGLAMNSDQMTGVYIVVGVVAFVFFCRRREALAHAVRGTVRASVIAAIAFVLLWKAAGLAPLAAYITALVIGVLVRRSEPRRSRYVSARTKRQAIAKFEKETGETFNRRIHEFDHVLAHSRGGGNAEDNIQVLHKKQNRAKGTRRTW